MSNPDIISDEEYYNWKSVEWFWNAGVQPLFWQNGVTFAGSVQIVNGFLECGSMGGSGINSDRANMAQCFNDQLGAGGYIDGSC
ncbi:hypothetical protein BCR33DRAFT_428421 [Rhizoclosmatium globosum]|uniref:Uncharacterized protein n=1 Tax=Rhizoclosmatium globosum TaxID=329046 RepID=A0A1Y2BUB1_9FUNG|nr:hypothetical protein BCR33DRAFT_428421 [Rhizoclosmatium globosum]|eukprot:ORY38323.1 hypothetical protein BCR33DRAFT_428421 [Rhizoclosmatium globosum]